MKQLLEDLLRIDDQSVLEQLSNLAKLEQFDRGERIMEIGQVQTEIRVLVSGAVRFYYLDEKGKEHTQCFVTEPGYPIMVDAYTEQSLSGCECIADTTLLSLPMEVLAMMQSFPQVTAAYVYMLRKSLLFHAELAMVLRACDAYRRYMWFRSTYPALEELAKSRHIASFLCITPETLSRVRAKARSAEENYGQMTLNDGRNFDELRQQIWEDTPLDPKEVNGSRRGAY